jgi:hypothetical protein
MALRPTEDVSRGTVRPQGSRCLPDEYAHDRDGPAAGGDLDQRAAELDAFLSDSETNASKIAAR